MLHPFFRNELQETMRDVLREHSQEELAAIGPAKIIDELIDVDRAEEPGFIRAIEENRQEAEQLVAGVLGLM